MSLKVDLPERVWEAITFLQSSISVIVWKSIIFTTSTATGSDPRTFVIADTAFHFSLFI
jgi:hypothetical protein